MPQIQYPDLGRALLQAEQINALRSRPELLRQERQDRLSARAAAQQNALTERQDEKTAAFHEEAERAITAIDFNSPNAQGEYNSMVQYFERKYGRDVTGEPLPIAQAYEIQPMLREKIMGEAKRTQAGKIDIKKEEGRQTRKTEAEKATYRLDEEIVKQYGREGLEKLKAAKVSALQTQKDKAEMERTQVTGESRVKAAKQKVGKGFAQSKKLRDEYTKLNKVFRDVRDSYARVQASSNNPSAAGDLALIFNYMKMLDPASVVRESEFATAAATGSYGQRLAAAGNKILQGERLSDTMRKDFVSRSNALFSRARGQYGQTREEYTNLAESFELAPEQIVIDFDDPLFEETDGNSITTADDFLKKYGGNSAR